MQDDQFLADLDSIMDQLDLAQDEELSGEDRTELDDIKSKLCRGANKGLVKANASDLTLTVVVGESELIFSEPLGASLLSPSRKGSANDDVSRMYVAMASMSGTTPATFAKMKMRHLKYCIAIAKIFLG